MEWKIDFVDENEYTKFLKKLNKVTVVKLINNVDLLEEYGIYLGLPFVKKLGDKLWELRISGKQKVRIIYTYKGNLILFLNYFVKKSQKTPVKELRTAKERLKFV